MATLTPASIWVQLGNLFFLLSGFAGDILIIRLFLVLAYTWLLTAAATGYPAWPHVSNPGYVSWDGLTWACLNLLSHGLALARLLRDERRVRLPDADHDALWRFFYRRSGMTKLEFLETMRFARLERFKAGSEILCEHSFRRRLVLLIDGLAHYTIEDSDGKELLVSGTRKLHSGNVFDLALLSVLGVYLGFEKPAGHKFTVTADTDCLVCFWTLTDLNAIATQLSPAVAAFWRNFCLCQLGLEWSSRERPDKLPVNARGLFDPPEVLQGLARSRDFTDPLADYEQPHQLSIRSFIKLLRSKFSLTLPPGIRHNAMPVEGVLARNRLEALGSVGLGQDEAACPGHKFYAHDDTDMRHGIQWASAVPLAPAQAAQRKV